MFVVVDPRHKDHYYEHLLTGERLFNKIVLIVLPDDDDEQSSATPDVSRSGEDDDEGEGAEWRVIVKKEQPPELIESDDVKGNPSSVLHARVYFEIGKLFIESRAFHKYVSASPLFQSLALVQARATHAHTL
jgi:hypothetical protein